MLDVPRDRFEELVSEALDTIPDDLARLVSNCVILVEDDVPARHAAACSGCTSARH